MDASLVSDAVTWASLHGLVVAAPAADGASALIHAPLALRPSPFPRAVFERATALATVLNHLMTSVAADRPFLREAVASAGAHDAFTADLVALMAEVDAAKASGAAARDAAEIAVLRADYMLDAPTGRLLQVETNTIAASFVALTTLVSDLHRGLARRHGVRYLVPGRSDALPENAALSRVVEALGTASSGYGRAKGWADGVADYDNASAGAARPVLLMVVQPGEFNAFDQEWISECLRESGGPNTVRATLAEVAAHGSVTADGGLTFNGHRVGCVYFRAGYTPDDYPTEVEWAGRRIMEMSDVPKCPTVALQARGSFGFCQGVIAARA